MSNKSTLDEQVLGQITNEYVKNLNEANMETSNTGKALAN
jgi:hypothetical protein